MNIIEVRYVNDTLDFTELACGYEYMTWDKVKPCEYKINHSEYVAIGNAGRGVFGSLQLSKSGSTGIDGDESGIFFNREFAVEANNYIENYDSSKPSDFKQEYDKNYAYTKKITQDQWDKLIQYHNEHNTYDLLWNNCILVATRAWNLIYPDDQIDTNTIPFVVKNRIKEKPNSFVYDLYSVLGYSL